MKYLALVVAGLIMLLGGAGIVLPDLVIATGRHLRRQNLDGAEIGLRHPSGYVEAIGHRGQSSAATAAARRCCRSGA